MTKKNDLLRKLLEVGGTKPTKELYMARFEDHFTIQAFTNKEMKKLREQATFTSKKGEEFDGDLFNSLVIVQGVIEPNFNAPEITSEYGTAEDAIQVLLLPGEIQRLSNKISELSGFGAEDEDEVKN